jgi:hypothetical protein
MLERKDASRYSSILWTVCKFERLFRCPQKRVCEVKGNPVSYWAGLLLHGCYIFVFFASLSPKCDGLIVRSIVFQISKLAMFCSALKTVEEPLESLVFLFSLNFTVFLTKTPKFFHVFYGFFRGSFMNLIFAKLSFVYTTLYSSIYLLILFNYCFENFTSYCAKRELRKSNHMSNYFILFWFFVIF